MPFKFTTVIAGLVCALVSGGSLFGQDWSQTPSGRVGVLMRPVPSTPREGHHPAPKRQAARTTPDGTGATITFKQLLRFPAEQPNVATLLASNFGAGLTPMVLNGSTGQYDAFFRDFFFAGETLIQNAQDGDSFSATAIGPNTKEDIPAITFHATFNGQADCFVGQSVSCGSTSLDVFWVGSGQCLDGQWSFQFLVNGSAAASSNPFYVHPRIANGVVPAPNVPVAPSYNQVTYAGVSYDSDCFLPADKKRPFTCDGRQGEVPYSLKAKGCAVTSSAMLLTYHGFSATPGYSVTPDVLNGFLETGKGYDSHGNVNWPNLGNFALSAGSSLSMDASTTTDCATGGCNDAGLYHDVCTFGPQIIAVNHDGNAYTDPKDKRFGQLKKEHWVTVVGQPDDKSTWIIEDPDRGIEGMLGQPLSNGRTYSSYLAIRAFKGPEFPNPPNAIGIKLFSPAE
ncbi:MAG: hypothetical protein JOZ15_08475, partial [Acidobacteria bacterium]|nr:hypothetical protein [Acidobacteriota bacterium]